MNAFIAILLSSLFLFLYIIFSSLLFGSSIFLLFPTLVTKQKIIYKFLNPVWELINLFLLFFFASMLLSFPQPTISFVTSLSSTFALALFFYCVRLFCLMLLFYKITVKSIKILLLITSFFIPMFFASSLTYALTGSLQNSIFSPISISLYFVVIFTIFSITSSYFQYIEHDHTENTKLSVFTSFSLLALLISMSTFVILLIATVSHLFSNTTVAMLFAIFSGITLALFSTGYLLKEYLLRFVAVCLFIAVGFFSLLCMHLPYLIYPKFTLSDSFAGEGIFTLLLLSYGIGLIVIIPSLILLFSFFLRQKQP